MRPPDPPENPSASGEPTKISDAPDAFSPPHARTFVQVAAPIVHKSPPPWFRPISLSLPPQQYTLVEDAPACLFSPLEMDLTSKQFEHALIMKFSRGRPSLQDIRSTIYNSWHLAKEPVISLIDPRHVLIIPANYEDMIMAPARDSHAIGTSMFRISRWTKDFKFDRDSTCIAAWIRLPKLPFVYFNLPFLERIGNQIGTFLRADERSINLQNLLHARLCVEVDVSDYLPQRIWIGESKDKGFWQKIEYEGNIAFCLHCGLMGHTHEVCWKKFNRKKSAPNGKPMGVAVDKHDKSPGDEGDQTLSSCPTPPQTNNAAANRTADPAREWQQVRSRTKDNGKTVQQHSMGVGLEKTLTPNKLPSTSSTAAGNNNVSVENRFAGLDIETGAPAAAVARQTNLSTPLEDQIMTSDGAASSALQRIDELKIAHLTVNKEVSLVTRVLDDEDIVVQNPPSAKENGAAPNSAEPAPKRVSSPDVQPLMAREFGNIQPRVSSPFNTDENTLGKIAEIASIINQSKGLGNEGTQANDEESDGVEDFRERTSKLQAYHDEGSDEQDDDYDCFRIPENTRSDGDDLEDQLALVDLFDLKSDTEYLRRESKKKQPRTKRYQIQKTDRQTRNSAKLLGYSRDKGFFM